jgi:hypothetical protein
MPIAEICVQLFFLLVPCLLIYALFAEVSRESQFGKAAKELGLTYFQKANKKSVAEIMQGSRLAWSHWGSPPQKLLTGDWGQYKVAVVDFRQTINVTALLAVTVACIYPSAEILPCFAIRKSELGTRFKIWFYGHQRVKLDAPPEFLKRYIVTGTDEVAISKLLSDSFLHEYSGQGRLEMECLGDRLLVYTPDKRVAPKQLGTFIDRGVVLASQLISSAGRQPQYQAQVRHS